MMTHCCQRSLSSTKTFPKRRNFIGFLCLPRYQSPKFGFRTKKLKNLLLDSLLIKSKIVIIISTKAQHIVYQLVEIIKRKRNSTEPFNGKEIVQIVKKEPDLITCRLQNGIWN